MHITSLLTAVVLFLTTIRGVVSASAQNVSVKSGGVLQPQDIGTRRMSRGRPIPELYTIYTLFYTQLELYRRTVEKHGDAEQETLDVQDEMNLRLEIRSFEYAHQINSMTLGSSFYGIASMIESMLNPENPADGFWEQKWRVFRKAVKPQIVDVPLGYLSLLMGNDRTFRKATSHDLGAPFQVPDTDMMLYETPYGADLVQGNVILIMSDLMSTAWQNVARNNAVRPIAAQVSNSRSRDRVTVTLLPKMNKYGRVSMVTDTDLAEAAFGLAYYFLTQSVVFESTVTVMRPDENGDMVTIGEVQILKLRDGNQTAGLGNDTAARFS